MCMESELLTCPFCGGSNLEGNEWHHGLESLDAVECVTCFASAPLKVWQSRQQPILQCPACTECFTPNASHNVTDILVL